MNMLILTAKFGLGHYKAAEGLKDKLLLEDNKNNIIIVDFFEYVFPDLYKSIYTTFNVLVNKCPTIYNFLNMLLPKSNPVPFKKIVISKLNDLIINNRIEQIISVVPICSEYISEYINIVNSDVKLNTLITDIEVHDSWLNDNTNRYFVPSNETKAYLVEKGVLKDKIIVTGIPVNSKFNVKKIKNHKKKVLIMGGGLGLIPNIDNFLSYLNSDFNLETTVILGNNIKLYKRLSKKYNNINVIGYTNRVYKYISEADLLVTKSGGITLFEAIETETPLLILKPFLVQEVGNAKFIQSNKIGKVIWNSDKNVYNVVSSLVNSDKELSIIRSNMHNLKLNVSNFDFFRSGVC